MKCSFEFPLALLKNSILFNDYNFSLLPYIINYPQYKQFYLQKKNNTILDNGTIETGELFNLREFLKWIEILKPKEYVVPDQLNNFKGTMKTFKKFLKYKRTRYVVPQSLLLDCLF